MCERARGLKRRTMRCTRLPFFLPSVSLLVFLLCFEEHRTVPVVNDDTALLYLQRFGYTEGSASYRTGSSSSEVNITDAVLEFQRFAGIRQTGVLDSTTLEIMTAPRCGVKDISGISARRRRRYVHQGSRWRMTRLTYRITKYPSRIRGRQRVDSEIARAFKVWSDVTDLVFVEKKRGRVNIEIRFEAENHGDGMPFGGGIATYAHAFFPQFGGDAHFYDKANWTINDTAGLDLFQIATHEFGHSLGLNHSDVRESVMAPFYTAFRQDFELDRDDITGIQILYGTGNYRGSSRPTDEDEPSGPPPDTSDAPDLCQNAAFDTITRTQNGRTYIFKEDFYWKFLPDGIADGYPRRISDDWDGLPGNLDASLTWSTGHTFFFKGENYWRFTNRQMDKGYPKLISVGFEGIPNNVDAAFVWSGNGKTYFFKGEKYWRYDSNGDPPVSAKYPRPISEWKGIPNKVEAAFQWEDRRTYFFKGEKYYRFNDAKFEVYADADPPYPRLTSVSWLGCRSLPQRSDSTTTSHDLNNEFSTPSPTADLRSKRHQIHKAYESASQMHHLSLSLLFASFLLYLVW